MLHLQWQLPGYWKASSEILRNDRITVSKDTLK